MCHFRADPLILSYSFIFFVFILLKIMPLVQEALLVGHFDLYLQYSFITYSIRLLFVLVSSLSNDKLSNFVDVYP